MLPWPPVAASMEAAAASLMDEFPYHMVMMDLRLLQASHTMQTLFASFCH